MPTILFAKKIPAKYFRAPSHRMAWPVFAVAWAFLVLPSAAEVKPNSLFSSHAVLQRDVEIPVWGAAAEGEAVTVRFAGQTATATTSNGKWQVKLKPMPASATPQTMTISGPANEVKVQDLLIGEVWVCSGQSNMEWTLSKSANGNAVAAKVNEPMIRLFQVPKLQSGQPVANTSGHWTLCDARAAARFSAVAYYFGRDLQRNLNVPIGLIGSYVGGTPAELWTSQPALDAHPDLKIFHERQRRAEQSYDPAKAKANYDAAMRKFEVAAAAAKANGKKSPRPPGLSGNPKGRGPSSLYNGMIAPLQPYAIRGAIWYQGESNRNNPPLYAKLFPALIADWRRAWNQGNFPFLFVQLAPYGAVPPELRDIQTQVWKQTPNTGMAVITDHGSAGNIHPPAKEPVGQRLALAARSVAYGQKITSSGPIFQSMSVQGSAVTLRFTSIGGGLTANGNDGRLKGFTLAGADGKFLPAEAAIRGETVVVTHPQVSKPLAVRYGWSNVPDVNLANREGLPAVPFRTDSPK